MFDTPEFFRTGIVATIYGSERKMHVMCEGERCATYRGQMLRTPEEFRAAFPDGQLPEMDTEFEWTNNGWFTIYDVKTDDIEEAIDHLDRDPEFSLRDAINIAIEEANNA